MPFSWGGVWRRFLFRLARIHHYACAHGQAAKRRHDERLRCKKIDAYFSSVLAGRLGRDYPVFRASCGVCIRGALIWLADLFVPDSIRVAACIASGLNTCTRTHVLRNFPVLFFEEPLHHVAPSLKELKCQ